MALRHINGFLLRHRFVEIGVKWLAGRIDLLQARFGQRVPELREDHAHASLERLRRAFLRVGGGGQRHVERVENGNQLLQQRLIGELHGVLALAGRALLEVFEISRRSQQRIPMLLGFGGLSLQLGDRCRRQIGVGIGRSSGCLLVRTSLRGGVCWFRLHLLSICMFQSGPKYTVAANMATTAVGRLVR